MVVHSMLINCLDMATVARPRDPQQDRCSRTRPQVNKIWLDSLYALESNLGFPASYTSPRIMETWKFSTEPTPLNGPFYSVLKLAAAPRIYQIRPTRLFAQRRHIRIMLFAGDMACLVRIDGFTDRDIFEMIQNFFQRQSKLSSHASGDR